MQDKKETELIMKKNMNTKTETKEATVAALLMQKNSGDMTKENVVAPFREEEGMIVFPQGWYSQYQDSNGDTNLFFEGEEEPQGADFCYWNDSWSIPVGEISQTGGSMCYFL